MLNLIKTEKLEAFMTDDKNEKIIEKIQKLLALSESSNPHEAERAAERAQALMLKHNIEMQSVTDHDSEYVGEETEVYKRQTIYAKYINDILANFFFVRLVTSRRSGGKVITIVGEKSNVQTAVYMREFLSVTFVRLWEQYKEETGSGVGAKQSFYYGVWKGFKDKMEAQKVEAEMRYDMVLVDDPKVNEKMLELFGKTSQRSGRRVNAGDAGATAAGYEQGQKISTNKAVSA